MTSLPVKPIMPPGVPDQSTQDAVAIGRCAYTVPSSVNSVTLELRDGVEVGLGSLFRFFAGTAEVL
jgi:hypothetical protein